MALRGMPSYSVDSGVCAMAMPPSPLISLTPSVPSLPVIGSVVVLAVVCSALAFVVMFALVAEIGPIRVAKIENKGKINRRIRLAFA